LRVARTELGAPGDQTAVLSGAEAGPAEGASLSLIIFTAGRQWVVPLDELGDRIIGRSPECDVPIDDETISRRHVSVTTTASGASVRDLGSSNGTLVNGRRVATAVLEPGTVVSLGRAQIILEQRRGRAVADLLSVDAFQRRLAIEVDRSSRYHNPITLALIGDRGNGALDDSSVSPIAAAARSIDSVARLDSGTVAVLMPELGSREGRASATTLLAAADSAGARCGVATWPADAYGASELLAAARGALEHAGEGAVATASDAVYIHEASDGRFVFAEPAMLRVVSTCRRLGPTDLPVLVLGETGTGKEIVARMVHDFSDRCDGPLVAVNCAAVQHDLAESELFGHVRGAFSGADQAREGKLQAASGGTLFFDEIGEMAPAIQAKILRVLESRKLTRLGENREISIDLRIVAATNRDLAEEVEAGRFRRDLYYRLCAATVTLPPLRQRPREVAILARHFLRTAGAHCGDEAMELSPKTLRILRRYPWPGNIRELRHVIQRAAAMTTGEVIYPSALPAEIDIESRAEAVEAGGVEASDESPFRPLAATIQEIEVREIRRALRETGGVRKRAAELLDMPLRTFYVKLKQYGLQNAVGDDR
jgi:DNA-binding NtrC family response regulator